MIRSLLCSLIVLTSVTVKGLHLPKYIKPCALRSPNFRECAVKNGNDAIPFLVKGDRAYGIPAFNPLKLSFIEINSNGLKMNLTDTTFSGAENLKLTDIEINNTTKTAAVRLKSSLIHLDFNYVVTGKLASFAIEGQGDGRIDIIDGTYGYEFQFDLVQRKGKTHLKVGKDKIVIDPKNMKIQLNNLFNGNKQLGDALNQFLNENWKEVLTEFSPTISEIFGAIARKVFERLLDRIPIEESFLDW